MFDRDHMRLSLKLTSEPANEPVATADAKNYLRVDTSDDDTLIASMVKAARNTVEGYTKRALITQTWALRLDAMPSFPGVYFFDSLGAIDLPKLPIQSITDIKTYSLSNVESVLTSDAYTCGS